MKKLNDYLVESIKQFPKHGIDYQGKSAIEAMLNTHAEEIEWIYEKIEAIEGRLDGKYGQPILQDNGSVTTP
jgi:hypothetical protein